jgi:hypothetical protein
MGDGGDEEDGGDGVDGGDREVKDFGLVAQSFFLSLIPSP